MFGRRKNQRSSAPKDSPYEGLRSRVLDVDPSSVGIAPTTDHLVVFGAVMETGYPNYTVTVVSLADGTTSLYTSPGFAIIGGGGHAPVVEATEKFLCAVENSLADFLIDQDSATPVTGQVTFRALTFGGRKSAQASEDDLTDGGHPLSGVFDAGQFVLTQLRLIYEEAESRG